MMGSSNGVDQAIILLRNDLGCSAAEQPIPSGLPNLMKSDREIEILFRRLRLYDELGGVPRG
jgi:hypothetical protein